MPQGRPHIPAEVEREVLLAAGHCCAVCGAAAPLELAHITPWSRSRDHSASNLVCLCANCHRRADTDQWGEKTLREYRQRPFFTRARPGEASGATRLSSLHQLPPPPPDFTGREADLAELRAAIESGGVTIVGIRGMGGIGKTALAYKLAEELIPLYPDAQLYLDLQGVSAGPTSAVKAMAHVIQTFHPEARLPEEDGDVLCAYRSALHGRRVLLLLDNAAGADQIRDLLPPKGSILLVTSRFLFHLPGLYLKHLDQMPPGDARSLLLRIEPRISDEADRIAEICAGLPFALRSAAGALAEQPALTPASYARRLAERKRRMDLVEASLRLSYDLLPKALQRRWRALATFPADFDASAAAAIWSLEEDAAEDDLGHLVRWSLVEGKDGRYRLHDLARVFARERSGKREGSAAQLRHADYYRALLDLADRLYLQGGEDLLRGLRLLDSEWPNIEAGQAWAADHAESDQQAAELAWDYPIAGMNCLLLRLGPHERINWWETALSRAPHYGDAGYRASALSNLGLACTDLGNAKQAIELHEQELAMRRELGDRWGEGCALNNLAIAFMDSDQVDRAIETFEQDLAICRKLNDRRGEGITLGNLGRAYSILPDTDRAIDFFERSLAIARERGDRSREGDDTSSLGLAYADLGDTRHAIELLEKSLAIARELGDRRAESKALWHLGEEFEKLDDLPRAIELMRPRVDYLREIGHPSADKAAAYVDALRTRLGT